MGEKLLFEKGDVFTHMDLFNNCEITYYQIIKGKVKYIYKSDTCKNYTIKGFRLLVQKMKWVKCGSYIKPIDDFKDRLYFDVIQYKLVLDTNEEPFYFKKDIYRKLFKNIDTHFKEEVIYTEVLYYNNKYNEE